MRSQNPAVVSETRERMRRSMEALRDVSRVWIVAKMVYTLFESILGNKALEERLQRSAAKRHPRTKSNTKSNGAAVPSTPHNAPIPTPTESVKRKFDDMEITNPNGNPTINAPMSYERSQPATPAPTTPAAAHHQPPGTPSTAAHMASPSFTFNSPPPPPHLLPDDPPYSHPALSPPATPFIPQTPPDLFLVTRSSPPIPNEVWQNFQPGHLFPEDSGFHYFSPPPQARGQTPTQGQSQQQSQMMDYTMTGSGSAGGAGAQGSGNNGKAWPAGTFDPTNMLGLDPNQGPTLQQAGSPDDTWSNSSKGGVVPTALNVEDWFNFFGLTGDLGNAS